MSGWKIATACGWFLIAAGLTLLGRMGSLIPFGPMHDFYERQADVASLKMFAVLAAPMLLLILVEILWRKLAR